MALDTQQALILWGHGSTHSEYMAAEILVVEGYTGIDPYTPSWRS